MFVNDDSNLFVAFYIFVQLCMPVESESLIGRRGCSIIACLMPHDRTEPEMLAEFSLTE
jgi:hypothetical protein